MSLPDTRVTYAHAFKLLAPDVLSSAILGTKGAGVQEVQSKTQTRISIADRNDRYPYTNSRLVLIRAHTAAAIDDAVAAIVGKIKSVAEAPRRPDLDVSEIVSKVATEFRIRAVLPKTVAGAVIGAKGATVTEMSKQTGCRIISVESWKIGDGDSMEQVVSLLGSLRALTICLARLNKFVQEACAQPWFSQWAHLNVNSKMHGGSVVNSYPLYYNGIDNIPGNGMSMYGVPDDDMVYRITRSMPRHLVGDRTFSVQASLPIEAMSGLIGKGGSGTREINERSGAKITLRDDDPNTTVTIQGHLNSVICGYMLLMKRYLEIELLQGSKGRGKEGKPAGRRWAGC